MIWIGDLDTAGAKEPQLKFWQEGINLIFRDPKQEKTTQVRQNNHLGGKSSEHLVFITTVQIALGYLSGGSLAIKRRRT